MRITSFLVATALVLCGAALGAGRSETATYVDGNINGVTPNTKGTLQLLNDKTMYLKTSGLTMGILYSGVTKAELGSTVVHSHGNRKTQAQLLTVGFRNPDGEDKIMTLELARPAAKNVVATIQKRTSQTHAAKNAKRAEKTVAASAKPAKPAADEWWGDQYWKTARNSDKWNKPAGTVAAEQE